MQAVPGSSLAGERVMGAMHPRAGANIQTLCRTDEFMELREAWDRLHDATPGAAPTMRFDWLWHWWRVYGSTYARGEDALRIIVVRREGRLIGALPLYMGVGPGGWLGPRRLGLISTGEREFEEICPDYMDLLSLPGERAAVVEAVRGRILEDAGWDMLDLPDLPAESPLLGFDWPGCRAVIADRGACPAADIRGGLEAYLPRLSANTRQQMRRLLRGAEKAGAFLELAATPGEAMAYFEDMVRLHQARWEAAGKPGVFSAPRFTDFHCTLAGEWVPVGRAVLARLRLGGEPLAVIYGFRAGAKFDFYQSGIAIDDKALRSPGMVAFLMLMGELAGRGVEEFDFLRGSSDYKERLSTHARRVSQLTVVRPTARSVLHFMGDLLYRASARGRRLVRG